MMKTKNYVKVGLVISIVLHVGIFALGGYVMNNITKELNEKSMLQSSTDEDITYVDIGITQEDESNDIVVEEFDYDMLLFFSPAGINSLMKNFPEFDQKEIAIGCFGPATAKAVKDAGLRLDLEAPTVEAPSMTAALDMFIRERNKD